MKTYLYSLLMLVSTSSFAQDLTRTTDKENGSVVLNGQLSFNDLEKEPTFEWFSKGAGSYKPGKSEIAYLTRHLPAYKLLVFMGTWCGDSHDLIPKLYTVLQQSNYPMQQVNLQGVDRTKATKPEYKNYKITSVPTIIVLKDNIELGRVTEVVKKDLETDLANIIRADLK